MLNDGLAGSELALNAADGGINDALTWLNNDVNLPTIPTAASPWTRPGDPSTRILVPDATADSRDDAVRYTVNLGFKIDTEDARVIGRIVGLIRDYEEASPQQVAEALAGAAAAFEAWRRTSFDERAVVLRRAALLLRERREPLARLMAKK